MKLRGQLTSSSLKIVLYDCEELIGWDNVFCEPTDRFNDSLKLTHLLHTIIDVITL